jgi:phospholipase D1/2
LSASHQLKEPLGKVELHKPDTPEQDLSLQEERTTYSREGKKEPGFASAMVPTLEEKVVQEDLPPASQAESPPLKDKLEHQLDGGPDPSEKHTASGEAYGAPALASKDPQTDDEPPHAGSGVNDADEQEKTAPVTRSLLRKHLVSNVSNKTWAVPVPAPRVDPEGFEDPISDAFWKNVWIACAVHNVCYVGVEAVNILILVYRLRFIARSSTQSLTTSLRRGSNTKNSFFTTNASLGRYVPLIFFPLQVSENTLTSKAKGSHSPDPVARMPSETAYENGPYQQGGVADTAEESHETFRSNDGGDVSPSRGPNPPDRDTRNQKPVHGVEPFTQQERDEMEKLLREIRGHLGKRILSLAILLFSYSRSCVSHAILRRRRYGGELPVQCRQVCCS